MLFSKRRVEPDESTAYLFVYGSLMRGMERAAFINNSHKARFVAEGVTAGKLYDLGSFPGMVEGENGSLVQGELYEILDPETFFATLDLIEGCWLDQPERSLYLRRPVRVMTSAGEKTAWAYFLNLPVAGLPEILSGDYRQLSPSA